MPKTFSISIFPLLFFCLWIGDCSGNLSNFTSILQVTPANYFRLPHDVRRNFNDLKLNNNALLSCKKLSSEKKIEESANTSRILIHENTNFTGLIFNSFGIFFLKKTETKLYTFTRQTTTFKPKRSWTPLSSLRRREYLFSKIKVQSGQSGLIS